MLIYAFQFVQSKKKKRSKKKDSDDDSDCSDDDSDDRKQKKKVQTRAKANMIPTALMYTHEYTLYTYIH